ncbi:hypothetical protein EW093_01615 [Thiospirochaeta perfilievii]|uniref:PPM-type phosphatase domain-containing protein n=1 Tax=Thiospirochaeta perfilievii TaxID=252967 RepID=A0A5C1Q5W6_9SPIO|nr:protein phosphatase 2C domain-containing protein [Thiospirochaeta perfilievii]QEN03453.1 hypothetical protein EW093_01615 [Thiospirochaeta perfilievii]
MKIDTITDTYKEFSEDVYGKTENCFWVLDGALSLSKANYTGAYSDIVWMVNWWNKYLSLNIEQFNKTIVTILEEGVDLYNREFNQYTDYKKLSKLDRSTSAIVVVRINNGIVECFGLGDCEINVRNKYGDIEILIDESVEDMDTEVINMIFNNKERKNRITFNGYTDEELVKLQKNRMRINEKNGYYILEHEKDAIKNGNYKEFKLSDVKDIILMSDGYSAIYNKYKQLTVDELMDKCNKDGVKSIIKLIRTLEEDDSSFKKYKRLRQHDDATAIYINI